MSEIENFGIFEITSSKTFRNCAIQVKSFILRNSLYKTGHPNVNTLLHVRRKSGLTCLKLPLALYSHSRRSKNNGIVAFLSSASGIKVTSKKGPTIPVVISSQLNSHNYTSHQKFNGYFCTKIGLTKGLNISLYCLLFYFYPYFNRNFYNVFQFLSIW